MTDRRKFIKTTAATLGFGLAALQTPTSKAQILGANDKARLAFVGLANRGGQLLASFKKSPDLKIAAFCDIDAKTLASAAERFGDGSETKEGDFRKLYDRKDIDGMVFATPDHWHAYQTVEACKAGKDVYCEKPLSTSIAEGRVMVQAARKYGRIVQVGIHRRSAPLYHAAFDSGLENKIGKVTVARTAHCSNMYPAGMGKAKPTAPPEGLDWELWLGPRPEREYQENIAPYKFRWWDEYCSQIANQGVHFFDLIRWALNEKAPASVCAMGGKFAVDDDRTIPDTLAVCFEFASGRLVTFNHFEANGNPIMATDENYRALGYVEYRGTMGTCYVYDNRYIIKPEKPGQFQTKEPRAKEEVYQLEGDAQQNLDATALHAQNFIDCMRSRKLPNTDVEEAHLSTAMSHLANISLKTRMRLDWDAEKERITNYEPANELLGVPYRDPWKLTL
ncbi:MAG: Gfo/Idh/MocA family oxidoreductase [Thermoguttaceae bacterium]|nr:Gfo/Idh/MocA family oxidoreductase [Thermoguttaceae bacterium]MBQ5368117.1 Gfo/Idh/MocA family oxidoreductase [Thermoguttaceae bacterium]